MALSQDSQLSLPRECTEVNISEFDKCHSMPEYSVQTCSDCLNLVAYFLIPRIVTSKLGGQVTSDHPLVSFLYFLSQHKK